jgi:hypothetical protein
MRWTTLVLSSLFLSTSLLAPTASAMRFGGGMYRGGPVGGVTGLPRGNVGAGTTRPPTTGSGAVTGPGGGKAVRGPNGGAAATNPAGGAAVRGPGGGGAAVGAEGGAAVRGPQGNVAVGNANSGTSAAGVAAGAAVGAAATSRKQPYYPPHCAPPYGTSCPD